MTTDSAILAASMWLLASLLLIVPLCSFAVLMRRWRLTPMQTFLLSFNWLLNRLMWRTTINRPLPVAAGQGAVVIANHRSSFDPMFIAIATRRMVHWMVAREYCVDWRLGWMFRAVEAIPASRAGVDTAATKQAIRLASAGELVGMLPEGRINETDQLLLPGRPGAALVALKARVPVIPCFIFGAPYNGTPAGPLFMPAHVRVMIGDPIDISEFYGREREPGVLEDLTKRFLAEMARLAGATDFVPQLAGRRWKPEEEAEATDAENEPEAAPTRPT